MSEYNLYSESKPFRWELASRSQLGRLIDDEFSLDQRLAKNIRDCSSRIISHLDSASIVFVGRSLESVNAYLQGIGNGTLLEGNTTCLNISLFWYTIKDIRKKGMAYVEALRAHMNSLGLAPESIINRADPVTFVDVVYKGSTFGRIFEFYKRWSIDISADFPALKRKLRFLGVTARVENGPNTWRWSQHCDWVSEMSSGVKSVSIDMCLWSHIANQQSKMTASITPDKWLSKTIFCPDHESNRIKALNEAFALYQLGLCRRERHCLAREIASSKMKGKFQKRIILSIKGLSYAS